MIHDQAEKVEHFDRIARNARAVRAAEDGVTSAAASLRDRKAELSRLLKARDRLMADAIEDRPLFDRITPDPEGRDAAPGIVEARAPELGADGDGPDRGPEAPPGEGGHALRDRRADDPGTGAPPTAVFLVIGRDGQPSYGVRAETRYEAETWVHANHPGDRDLAVIDPADRKVMRGKKVPPNLLVFDVAEERARGDRERAARARAEAGPEAKKRRSKPKGGPHAQPA